MTDTGHVPGEGLPEDGSGQAGAHPEGQSVGGSMGSGWLSDGTAAPATAPAYAFADQPDGVDTVDEDDDLLLMPGPQGSWSEPVVVRSQDQPAAVRHPTPPPAAAPGPAPAHASIPAQTSAGTPAQGTPAGGIPAQHTPAHSVAHSVQAQTTGAHPLPLGGGEPAEEHGAAQGAHEAGGRDAGSLDPGTVRGAAPDEPGPTAPAGVPPVGQGIAQEPEAVQAPGGAAAGQAPAPAGPRPQNAVPQQTAGGGSPQPARRPLHLGPPLPGEATGTVSVRSLADRGPAPAAAAPQTGQPTGPEYLDVPRDATAVPVPIPAQAGPAPTVRQAPAQGGPVEQPPGDLREPAGAPDAGGADAPPVPEAQAPGVAVESGPQAGPEADVPQPESAEPAARPDTSARPLGVPASRVDSFLLDAPQHPQPHLAQQQQEPQQVPEPQPEGVTQPEAVAQSEAVTQPEPEGVAAPQAAAPVPVPEPAPAPQPDAAADPAEPVPTAEAAPEAAPSAPEPEPAAPMDPVPTGPVQAEPMQDEPPQPGEPVADPAPEPVPAAADADHPAAEAVPAEGEAPASVPAEDPAAEAPTAKAPAAEDRPVQGPPAEGYDEAVRDAVHQVIRERRDIRNGFRQDPIPHEVLLRVLEAAHTAPSVGHSQPWDFVVIRSAETRQKMHEMAARQRKAYEASLPKGRAKQFKELKVEAILDTPVNIVVTADPTRGGRHTLGRHTQPQMAPYSSALAVENLWLAARAEGLGVGWVSFFDEREMVRELGLPEHLEVVAYLCVGYVDEFPDEPELLQAGWSKRRPLAWVVHEEEYGNRVLPGEDPHSLLDETLRGIRPLDAKALGEAWERQKRMTKPPGALGMLEIISAQLSGLSRQCPPPIPEPAAVAVFAGDHGVHAQGVTAWPQEVTAQMVMNFLGGGAVVNAFATQVGAEVCVIDVGVGSDLPQASGLLPRKVRPGTADFTVEPAMTRDEALRAIEVGIETARDLVAAGNKALLTGEMGIANTTVSAALVSVFTGADPAEVTGRGTGINDEMHARKVDVVRRALELHQPDPSDPVGVLTALGGLEHAALVGLLLGGASLRTPVILDGVSAGAAALVARAIAPEVLAACVAGHRSAEPGHVAALNKLGLRPLIDLDLRLGEGTGALLALPVVQSAARAMHEVATFDSAGVTEKS